MDFPFYEIQLKPRKLENGKYKAGCAIRQNVGNGVIDILSKWELDKKFDSKEAANTIMRFNAKQYLIREHGPKALKRVKITQT